MKSIFLFSDWTANLMKFLKDQLVKLQDYYQHPLPSNGNGHPTPPIVTASPLTTYAGSSPISEEHKIALKQWQYCVNLAKYLYEVFIKILILFYFFYFYFIV